jgi:hypothetical protein
MVFFPCLILLSACAPLSSYHLQVEERIAHHRYAEADALVEKEKERYGERNAVLYHMDRAMTLTLSGRYPESNKHLELAEQRIDELYTRSVTTAAGAMLTNDNLLPYEGEDFEKVMLYILGALNYVALGQWDDALVEARRVDHTLTLLNDRYERKNVYKEDAFARYLSGILYESRGELNDAFIAYRKADETYEDYRKVYGTEPPSWLPSDLLRLSDALHLPDEFQEYRVRFPEISFEAYPEISRKGELIFIALNGRSPVKEDFFLDAPIPDGRGGLYLLRVALPRMVPIPSRIDRTQVTVRNGDFRTEADAERVEDITAIGEKNLEDRISRITAKAIARVTSKYLASLEIRKKAAKEGGEAAGALAGFLTNVYSATTEQADKRSWRTLPGDIRLARIRMPPGTYEVEILAYGSSGQVLEREVFPTVTVRAGEKTFLSRRLAW